MKVTLLICTAAALAFSASAAARVLPGFNSPTGNIKCYYNPHGLSQRGFSQSCAAGSTTPTTPRGSRATATPATGTVSRSRPPAGRCSTAPPGPAATGSTTERSSTGPPGNSDSSCAPPATPASPASTGTATACSSRARAIASGSGNVTPGERPPGRSRLYAAETDDEGDPRPARADGTEARALRDHAAATDPCRVCVR